ncbi:hypothetical protein [Kosakonia cowanii]|uniref:hypothetical protein n=1 Tax=Kosakonia cowanii TaxID=208223 RepID=UPI0022E5E34F|nr:hypothetical protein [Kosakonia cowanii]
MKKKGEKALKKRSFSDTSIQTTARLAALMAKQCFIFPFVLNTKQRFFKRAKRETYHPLTSLISEQMGYVTFSFSN